MSKPETIVTPVAAHATALEPSCTPDRRALESYAAWLFYERRLVCLQIWPQLGSASDSFVLGGNAGFNWHFDGWSDPAQAYRKDAASRAAAVLDLAGVDWRAKRRRDRDLIDLPDLEATGERPPLPAGWPAADAELMELARQVVEAVATYDALAEKDEDHPDIEAAGDRENALVAALADAEPMTIAGLIAKARVAQRVGDDITSGVRGRLFFSLALDIIRLAVPLEQAEAAAA